MSTPSPAKLPLNAAAYEDMGARLERYWALLSGWVQGNLLELTIAVGAAVAIFLLLSWLRSVASKVARASEHRSELKSIIARTLARTSIFFRIMISVELVNGYANAPQMVASTIDVLFTIAAVFQVAVWLREIILGLIERRAEQGEHEHETLASAMVLIRVLVSFALFAIAAIVILDNLGVNVTGLVAGLGVGGIAIGLAAQGIFSDLFAAISIIFDKPFRRGDVISYGTTTATVEKIGMKSTKLRALSGEAKIISNSKLLDQEITNFTLLSYRRTTFTLALVYNTPTEKIAALPDLLKAAIEANSCHFVRAGFAAFGASSIDVQFTFDVESTDYNEVFGRRHHIGLAILDMLRREQIETAYPTQTTFTAAPDGTLVMPYAPPTPKPVKV
ncbi:MAG: mechanosensitive ion channel domain-containing protein [Sphingorhabdus sp.]